jgi:hypothetical protein
MRDKIEFELRQLGQLLAAHKELIDACHEREPTAIELSALAMLLHSFYTGVENIFKRIAVEADGDPVRGEAWHRDLLDRMAAPGARRTAVISTALRDQLDDYLAFRHVFRHVYTFELSWAKLAPLILGYPDVQTRVCAELMAFVRQLLNPSR